MRTPTAAATRVATRDGGSPPASSARRRPWSQDRPSGRDRWPPAASVPHRSCARPHSGHRADLRGELQGGRRPLPTGSRVESPALCGSARPPAASIPSAPPACHRGCAVRERLRRSRRETRRSPRSSAARKRRPPRVVPAPRRSPARRAPRPERAGRRARSAPLRSSSRSRSTGTRPRARSRAPSPSSPPERPDRRSGVARASAARAARSPSAGSA